MEELVQFDDLSEKNECSNLDSPTRIETPMQNSDSEDISYSSYYQLCAPNGDKKYRTNYAKCLSDIIANSLEDNVDSLGTGKPLNINFEMFPNIMQKEKLKKEDEFYEIFPSVEEKAGSDREGDNSNESWCEEAKFKEYYDNFTMNIDHPKFQNHTNDDILMDNPQDESLEKFLKDLPLFRDQPYNRKTDLYPEVIESNFQAQMEWKVEWEASNSDEERESANKEMFENELEDEELWPGPANDDKNLICYYCNYTTSQQRYLNYHINTKHIVRQYSCCRCSYNTTSRKNLQKHIESVHVLKCHFCDFKSLQKDEIKVHMNTVHLSRELWECTICNFITPNKYKIDHHIKAAHPQSNDKDCEPQYNKQQCFSCPYSSTSKKELALHLKTAHLTPKMNRCVICDYKPKTLEDHEDHNEKCHGDQIF